MPNRHKYLLYHNILAIDNLHRGHVVSFFKECFIKGLKEDIREQVMMQFLVTWLEVCVLTKEVEILVNA